MVILTIIPVWDPHRNFSWIVRTLLVLSLEVKMGKASLTHPCNAYPLLSEVATCRFPSPSMPHHLCTVNTSWGSEYLQIYDFTQSHRLCHAWHQSESKKCLRTKLVCALFEPPHFPAFFLPASSISGHVDDGLLPRPGLCREEGAKREDGKSKARSRRRRGDR